MKNQLLLLLFGLAASTVSANSESLKIKAEGRIAGACLTLADVHLGYQSDEEVLRDITIKRATEMVEMLVEPTGNREMDEANHFLMLYMWRGYFLGFGDSMIASAVMEFNDTIGGNEKDFLKLMYKEKCLGFPVKEE